MQRIFLIGFMGSGKSTLGRRLAKAMNLPFSDLDKLIENEAGISVGEYFSQYGEDAFRKLERQMIDKVCTQTNGIIATGGGAPCFFDNMQKMNEFGTTVYLRISPEELSRRLSTSATDRPLLRGKSGDELLQYIRERLHAREPFYLQSKQVLESDCLKETDLQMAINNYQTNK
jgi:shikimate kinase